MDDRQIPANGWQRPPQSRNADPRTLLATYPMASVTPVMHPGSHLSSLTQVAPLPIYMQPELVPGMVQDAFSPSNPQAMRNSFLNRLSVPTMPTNVQERAFWEANQQQASRSIAQQAAAYPNVPNEQANRYSNFNMPSNRRPNPDIASYASHPPTSAYAQSILSSGPFASRQPDRLPFPSYPPTHYPPPSESTHFFNQFLQTKTQEMRQARAQEMQAYHTPRPSSTPSLYNPNTDPMSRPPSVSPQKRKAIGEPVDSPSVKRVHSVDHMSWSPTKQSKPDANTLQPVPVTSIPTAHPNQTPFVQVTKPPGWSTPRSTVNALQQRMSSQPSMSSPLTVTPSPKKQKDENWHAGDSDDDGYDSRIVPPSTQSRPGDRDERNSTERFISYIEDIFEAEDSLPADPPTSPNSDSYDFFSKLTSDWTRPNLNIRTIAKFTKLVEHIAHPAKRTRIDALSHSPSPGHSEELANVEFHQLSRVIKILERTVLLGEDVDPFEGPTVKAFKGTAAAPTNSGKSPAKGKKVKRDKSPSEGRKTRSKSRTPVEPDDPIEQQEEDGEVDEDKIAHALRAAKESVLAADACLALLGADHLPKQLYSEELITACLNVVKNQLTRIIYPFLEAGNDFQDHVSKALLRVVKQSDAYAKTQRGVVAEIFQTLVSILPRIDTLVRRTDFTMSDSITIQAVFISIGPFFVADPSADGRSGKGSVIMSTLGGPTALRGLSLSALSLIRSLFANNEEQRAWIVEEILTSLIKIPDLKHKSGQFRLRDGKSIHTVSALLFQLVQTSPHMLRHECNNIAKQRRFAPPSDQETLLSESERAEISLYSKGLDSAHRVAKTIVVFLTQRSGKTKAAKSSNEAEYRAILDNLISDLLTVLYLPEWPAAAVLLGVATRLFVASLDDVKTNASVDNSATRSTALEHLGTIASRLRAVSLRSNISDPKLPPILHSLDEGIKAEDNEKIGLTIAAHEEMAAYLARKSLEDSSNASAQDLSGAIWGHEMATALTALEARITELESTGQQSVDKTFILGAFRKIKGAMQDVWRDAHVDVFSVSTENDTSRVEKVSERLGNLSPLNAAFDPVLNVILGSLDAAAVFMRTKALRALGQILTSDPLVLKKPNVRLAIEEHLLDNSPAVRDAAVELIGKYVVQLPEVAGDYYEKIADRILDTGLGVRKRVIKLLKVFYLATSDIPRRVDIASRLAHRMLDEDDGVKDLAVKALEEVWFEGDLPPADPPQNEEQPSNMPTVLVILGVVSQKDRQANVSDFLHRIVTEKPPKEAQQLHDRYTRICDTLIDTLVDGRAAMGFSVLSCVKAVQIFVDAKPSIISSAKAASLLPYLKNASTTEEQNIADNLLRIFRACIPSMTKAALKFGQELQTSLQLMIVKPSSAGGLQTMQEAIACFCVVVNHLTHDYARAIGLLKSCLVRLNDSSKKLQAQPENATLSRQMQLLVCMVALLGEHCNMDKIREDHKDLATDINSITRNSVNEHIYKTMVKLYTASPDATLRNRVLQCLGFLFRAYPTLMTHESSAHLMDQIFSSGDEEAKTRLLKILQDFLSSESAKHAAQEKAASANKKAAKGVDMEAFVGNTHGFAESGVSSAIVQRYLPEILDAALVQSPIIQNAAVDILGFTIKQGLAHPLQCLPVIIALETTDNQQLSGRASALHTILHTKHASLIHSRYLECVQVAFRYQQTTSKGETVQGFRTSTTTTAVLHKWYSLVKEKRQTRLDFIRTITKAFDVDSTKLSSTDEEVQFVRFVVENLSAFDYKTQEEVLAVIRAVTNVLSVSGMQMMEVLAPSDLMRQLHSGGNGQEAGQAPEEMVTPVHPRSFEPFSMARASVILAMLLLLKSHLKAAFGLSEDKCSKWVPGKKSAIGDKGAVRKIDRPLYWDRLPFAIAPIQFPEDVTQQQERFVQLWEADPIIAEPEDEMALDG